MAEPPGKDNDRHTERLPAAGDQPGAEDGAFGQGQIIGSYRLLGRLGEGGVGVVYSAQHLRLSRRAAVKVLRPEYTKNPDMVRRFFNEAESVNLVQHPGIVTIFEFGQLESEGEGKGTTAFIVMELLDGETLRGRLRAQGGRLGGAGLRLMRQVASALAAAHARGIIHRDLKPENIMIVRDPDVPGGERTKLLDFGIAKVAAAATQPAGAEFRTQAGQIMGTPAYMSPEQLRDTGAVDDRADVYSLGVMLFEVTAGRLPFSAPSMAEIVGMHLFNPPPPLEQLDPSLPPELCRLVAAMLGKDPAVRPSMAEVMDALEGLSEQPGRAGASSVSTGASQAPRPATLKLTSPSEIGAVVAQAGAQAGGRGRLALVLLGGAALLGGGAVVAYQRLRQEPPPPVTTTAPPPPPRPEPPPPVDLLALRERSLAVLREGLRDPDPVTRRRSAGIIGLSLDGRNGALLSPLLGDGDPAVQAQSAAALRLLGARGAEAPLLSLMKDRRAPEEVRLEAAGALAQLSDESGIKALEKALRERDPARRERAAVLLGERGDQRARELVIRGGAVDEEHAAALGRLFRFGDREAEAELRRALSTEGPPGELQLRAAAELARGDDAAGRAYLEKAAREGGPESMRAARLLAALDDPSFHDRFLRCFPSEDCAVPERLLSAEGLGASGRRDAAPVLGAALEKDPRRALRLRLSAAGAVLQIAARDPEVVAAVSLKTVEEDLKGRPSAERREAAEALGDAEPRLSLPLLRGALKDEAEEVRRGAAVALGRTRVREAVPVLGEALSDKAAPVRKEAMESIGRVGAELRKKGEAVSDVLKVVEGRAGKGDSSERLAGVTALLRLGATEKKEELQQQLKDALRSSDASIRRQAIEAWSADSTLDPELLVGAMGDRSPSVRFAAAAGLAGRGRREGVPVLVQQLGNQTPDAVVARGLLQRLGLATPGEIVLGSGPPAERAAMVSAATQLPSAEALKLLQRAARDVAARVRLRVVAVLGDLPELARTLLARRLLTSLLSDRDALVRGRAGLLFGRLGLQPVVPGQTAGEAPEPAPAPDLAPAEPAAPDLAAAADLAAAPAARGHLEVEVEPEVRFQIDRRPQQTGPGKPVGLSPGRHRVAYSGGTLEVEVPAGETVTVRVPLSTGEQLLQDGIEAFAAGDTDRAQGLLSRAQGLLGHGGGASKERWYGLYYHQGRILEAQGRFVEALGAYERLQKKVPEKDRSAEQRAQLEETLGRVRGKLGRVRVSKEVDGKCQATELWLPPGTHMIDVGGDSREVRVRAGETQTVQACQ